MDHRDGEERNNARSNLRYLCKGCNTRLGIAAARAGYGRRVSQFNPGAETLREYVQAALEHRRGTHDPAGLVIHLTPKAQRREFAAEIWRRRRDRGTD